MTTPFSQQGRALLNAYPLGAGGFAARGVAPSHPYNTLGHLGVNVETNPRVVHDDTGRAVDSPGRDGTYKPPTLVVVESWRRDPVSYPNNYSFRLNFPRPLRDVEAIEVLEVNVPNVASTPPDHREFLLVNGLVVPKDATFVFTPQRAVAETLAFGTMVANTANDPNIDRSAVAWDDTDHFQLDDHAFIRLPYKTTDPMQYFTRDGWHRKSWFAHPIPCLNYLDFALTTVFGEPYDLPTAAEWSATLQIICK